MSGGRRLRRLAQMSSTDLGDGATTLLLPIGSCEQHGSHLPLSTDAIVATELASLASESLNTAGMQCVVAPSIDYGASGEHADFVGTLSVGTSVLREMLIELARSADWAKRLVFVNGHGGNATALTAAVQHCHHEGRHWVSAWAPSTHSLSVPSPNSVAANDDLHAGWVETSVMLALRPALVRLDLAEAGPVVVDHQRLFSEGVAAVSPNGVLGDPAAASAELGHQIIAHWTQALVGHVTGANQRGPLPPLNPTA